MLKNVILLTDDQVILICVLAFLVGAAWGAWLGYSNGRYDEMISREHLPGH